MATMCHHPWSMMYLVLSKKQLRRLSQTLTGPDRQAYNASERESLQFKMDIRNEPIHEEDRDAQTALSNVANTLRAVST